MIYLDHNATAPMPEAVREAMLPWLGAGFGNPSSVHRAGRAARAAIDSAREQVAALVGAHPGQLLFTSGGTEANNLALKGVVPPSPRWRLSTAEHPSLREPALRLKTAGRDLEFLPVSRDGRLDHAACEAALRAASGGLLSVIWANNETGAINDIPALAALARASGWLMHSDAVQAAGKLAVDFGASGLDLLTLSAHKIGGPKGVGALVARRELQIRPQLEGGAQERGLRGGTENVAGIVGFGQAAALAAQRLEARVARALDLRKDLEIALKSLNNIEIFSEDAPRVSNTVMFAMADYEAEAALMELDRRGFAVASGAACHEGSGEPSHVLLAMGYDPKIARSGIRVSLGEGNDAGQVAAFAAAIADMANATGGRFGAVMGGAG